MRENLKNARKAARFIQQAMAGNLEQLSAPLVEYLRENHHPHTAIVVTDERVVVVEDVMGIPFRKYETKDIPTCELVAELEMREGVENNRVSPSASIEVKADGPAIVLTVID